MLLDQIKNLRHVARYRQPNIDFPYVNVVEYFNSIFIVEKYNLLTYLEVLTVPNVVKERGDSRLRILYLYQILP